MIRLLQAAYHQAALLWYTALAVRRALPVIYHRLAEIWNSCVVDQTAEEAMRAAYHRAALDDYLAKGE
jgi:hypothetical protein